MFGLLWKDLPPEIPLASFLQISRWLFRYLPPCLITDEKGILYQLGQHNESDQQKMPLKEIFRLSPKPISIVVCAREFQCNGKNCFQMINSQPCVYCKSFNTATSLPSRLDDFWNRSSITWTYPIRIDLQKRGQCLFELLWKKTPL